MCKYAGGEVHASADFARLAAESPASFFASFASRGLREIKGKGVLETFDVVFSDGRASDAIAAATRTAAEAPDPQPPSRFALYRCEGHSQLRRVYKMSGFFKPSDLEAAMREGLSREGCRFMADRATRLRGWWPRFVDSGLERAFVADDAGWRRETLTVGVLMHAVSVGVQFAKVVWPDYAYDWSRVSADELGPRFARVTAALQAHWALSWAASAALLACLWLSPPRHGLWCAGYVAICLAHLGVSLGCLAEFPGDGWLGTFPLHVILVHMWMGALPLTWALLLTCTGPVWIAYVFALAGPAGLGSVFNVLDLGSPVLVGMAGSLLLPWALDSERRRAWRLRQLMVIELEHLRVTLLDLLPADVAEQMLELTERPPPCQRRVAVVLQVPLARASTRRGCGRGVERLSMR